MRGDCVIMVTVGLWEWCCGRSLRWDWCHTTQRPMIMPLWLLLSSKVSVYLCPLVLARNCKSLALQNMLLASNYCMMICLSLVRALYKFEAEAFGLVCAYVRYTSRVINMWLDICYWPLLQVWSNAVVLGDAAWIPSSSRGIADQTDGHTRCHATCTGVATSCWLVVLY